MPNPATDPLGGRLTIVLAAAGYGKTRAVRAWLGSTPAVWHRGADLAGSAAAPVPPPEPGARVAVVDDAHAAPAGALASWLGAAAAGEGRLVLIARRPLPAAALREVPDVPVEVGPGLLALSVERTARLLVRRHGLSAPGLAARVHRLAGGWPVLTRFLGAALSADPALAAAGGGDEDLLATLAAPGTPVAEYLAAEVLAGLPAAHRRLLADAVPLGPVCAELAAVLGHARPERTVAELARLGLLTPAATAQRWSTPVPMVAVVARAAQGRGDDRAAHVLATGAAWHERGGRPAEALRLRLAAGDHAGCAGLLDAEGENLLAGGAAAGVVEAIRRLPDRFRGDRLALLLAEGLEILGDTDGALAVYATLARDAQRLPAALAWRYGVAVYLWGAPRDALGIFRRGVLAGEDTAAEALLLAWTAAAYWLAGDAAACREHALRACRAAGAAGDDRAMATAHVAQALCANLDGDPAALRMHYARALVLAEAAGDVVQATRIRTNLAAGLEREARFAEALEMVRPAVALAERAGHVSMLARALCNEAALLQRLGQLDDALARHRRSIELYQRIGSDKVAYPLNGLGDIHRQRGRLSAARAAYAEAIRTATRSDDRQGLVPGLVGLARVIEDEPAAAATAARALRSASGPQRTGALLASGWVALRAGDRPEARQRALAAAESAGCYRDHTGLAEALELRAAAADPREARQALLEALAIWQEAKATLDAARVCVALAALPGARADQLLSARLGAARLAAAGVMAPAPTGAAGPPSVRIRLLGSFAVFIDGVPVPASAWRSRKARDVLRILAARRGRPVPKDELAELLWGEAAGDLGVAHRLAVALSTARGVLDPSRCTPADHFIAAGPANLRVDLDHIEVDAETLLRDARDGLRLHAEGATDDARVVLAAAERAYTGEVFADEPYDAWAQPLRDQVRVAYLEVLRALAELDLSRGGSEAVRRLRRILDIEPHDERSHRALVDLLVDEGRHGEARRAFAEYADAMREIGLPAPEALFPPPDAA